MINVQAPNAFKVMQNARKDPAVVACQEQLDRARAQLAHCDRIMHAQTNEIMVLERKRVQKAFPHYAEPLSRLAVLGVFGATIGCGALVSHLPIPPLLQLGCTAGAFAVSAWGVIKGLRKALPPLLARDIRKQFGRERPACEQQVVQSRATLDAVFQTTVERYMKEAEKAPDAEQPAGAQVKVDDEEVSIGGMKLPRRT